MVLALRAIGAMCLKFDLSYEFFRDKFNLFARSYKHR